MRELVSKLFEKGVNGSPRDPLTKGDILNAAKAEPSLVGALSAKGEDKCSGEDDLHEAEESSSDGDEDEDEDEESD